MSEPSVYLAGPVMYPDDGGHGWRDYVKDEWADSAEWVDPLDKYDTSATEVEISDDPDGISPGTIVEEDKAMIDGCDAVLVGWSRVPSVGTPMEVMYSFDRDIPVAVWYEPEGSRKPITGKNLSPWLEFHAGLISESFTDCLNWVEKVVSHD